MILIFKTLQQALVVEHGDGGWDSVLQAHCRRLATGHLPAAAMAKTGSEDGSPSGASAPTTFGSKPATPMQQQGFLDTVEDGASNNSGEDRKGRLAPQPIRCGPPNTVACKGTDQLLGDRHMQRDTFKQRCK